MPRSTSRTSVCLEAPFGITDFGSLPLYEKGFDAGTTRARHCSPVSVGRRVSFPHKPILRLCCGGGFRRVNKILLYACTTGIQLLVLICRPKLNFSQAALCEASQCHCSSTGGNFFSLVSQGIQDVHPRGVGAGDHVLLRCEHGACSTAFATRQHGARSLPCDLVDRRCPWLCRGTLHK